ncbi:pilus assembly protein FimV [Vreelandella subterranea]|uniref:Pilus assembly protein FimV n=1 Tax=Vreelandella subterranea TaxID=416874 RepID=A0A1H9VGC8_9GAMM|nr:FimV/HubP family polar landmark protein [Halomonas subterranea]SES20628.1 pilus assembly protein FimV [Halomonas subterranea]
MKQLGALAVGLWLSMVGSIGWALELGPAQVQSRLEAPLQAVLPLVDGDAYSPSAIEVSVAGEGAFADAGVEWTPMAGRVQAAIQERQGQPVVVLTSNQPITSPWLDLLLTVESPDGRQSQAITLLFDPADYGAADRPAASVAPQPAAGNDAAENDAPAVPQNREAAQGDAYVRSGDTLWSVAARTKPAQASVQQMMLALLEANPSAFPSGNIHEMRAAQRLTLPDESRVMARSAEQAAEAIRAMNAAWQRRDENGPAPVAMPEVDDPADNATATDAGPVESEPVEEPQATSQTQASSVEATALSAARVLANAATNAASPSASSSTVPSAEAEPSPRVQQALEDMREEITALREEVDRLSETVAAQPAVPASSAPTAERPSFMERVSDYQWWLLLLALVLLVALLVVIRRRQQWETPPTMSAAAAKAPQQPAPSTAGRPRVSPSVAPAASYDDAPAVTPEAMDQPAASEAASQAPPKHTDETYTEDEAPFDRSAMVNTQAAGLVELGDERRLALKATSGGHKPSLWLAPPADPEAVAATLSSMAASKVDDAPASEPRQSSTAPDDEGAWIIDYEPPTLASESATRKETPMQPTVDFESKPATPSKAPASAAAREPAPEQEWEIEEVAFAPTPRDNGAPSSPGNVDKRR